MVLGITVLKFSLNPIKYCKRKKIRQEWFRRIKRGQNEKYLPKDSTLYICLEYLEKYEIHCKLYTLLYTKFWRVLIRNFEHISYLVLVFLLLILNRQMPIENFHVLANFQVPKYSLCILLKIVTTRIRLPIFNWCFVYIFQNIDNRL